MEQLLSNKRKYASIIINSNNLFWVACFFTVFRMSHLSITMQKLAICFAKLITWLNILKQNSFAFSLIQTHSAWFTSYMLFMLLLCLQAKGLCGECRFNCCQGSCGEWCVEACRASCDCRSPSMTGCLDAICPQRRVCRKYISFWHFSITSLICGREIFIKIACQLSEG